MVENNNTGTSNGNYIPAMVTGRRLSDSSLNLQPVDEQSLIQHEGKTGIFVPLTKDEQASDSESQKNLLEVLVLLKKRVKELEAEKKDLQQQLKMATEKPARTPDDFVTAISHSVDSLQAKLADMNNPTSNFVVRDFKIDTKVFMDVTALGTVDYRFIQPGDEVDANKLTNISLSLAPTPKQNTLGSYSHPDFTPFEDINEIQGIGEVYKDRLKEKNIYTVSDLLHAGTRVRSKVELASMLEVDHRKLGEWLSHAKLLTVKEIDGRSAEVLVDLGIVSLEDLAQQSAESLTATYNERVEIVDHDVLKPIEVAKAQKWINAAQTYVGKPRDVSATPEVTSPQAEPSLVD